MFVKKVLYSLLLATFVAGTSCAPAEDQTTAPADQAPAATSGTGAQEDDAPATQSDGGSGAK